MNREQHILAILYEMALVIGGEMRVKPLLTKTLQRLLFHTSFPAGLVFCGVPPDAGAPTVAARIGAVVGDYELGACIGRTVALPAALLYGGAALREDADLLEALPGSANRYAVFLRLPIDHDSVILLLAPVVPHTELPLTRIFQPVMANLAKAILLCRHNEAYTGEIIADRDAARENLRKVRQAEQALRESEEKFRQIATVAQDAIIMMNNDGRIAYWNPAAERIFGHRREEALGKDLHAFLGAARYLEAYEKAHERFSVTGEGVVVGKTREIEAVRKDGAAFPVELSISALRLGGKWGAVGILRDITERKQMEAQLNASLAEKERLVQSLNELATRDGLTGLYNHRTFYTLIGDELARAQRFERPVSLLLLDVDHFKRVNDTYGHLAGDAALRGLGELLGREARAVDRVCRYGGEEIAVILPETDPAAAARFAERLRAAVEAQVFGADSEPIRMTVSIGVASWPVHADGAEALVAAADTAMYTAKQDGRNRVVRYEPAPGQPAAQG
ncbi:MAG: sensor domain-containing diguanylate cyclase [Thiobacillus sp.]